MKKPPYPIAQHKGVQYYIVPAKKDPDGSPSGCEGCTFFPGDEDQAYFESGTFECPTDEKGSRHKGCCDAQTSSEYSPGKFYTSWWIPKTEEAVAEYIATMLTT